MDSKNEIDPRLVKKLSIIQTDFARNPERTTNGRLIFLQEAQKLGNAVTPLEKRRHIGWMHAIQSIFIIHKKEHSPMFSTLATIILMASLVLGGGSVTVVAAQNSQPDQALYGVKILSEDVRLGISGDPQSEYQIVLEFTNRREEEIQRMLQAGSIPPESIQMRYRNQIEQAVQYAMELPDQQTIQALAEIQTRMQLQQQAILQVNAHGSQKAEACLLQIRQMLQEHLQWVEVGITDPTQLRDQLRLRKQQHSQDQQNSTTSSKLSSQTSPGSGSGNPWTTGTATPGSGYGPGQGSNSTLTTIPGSGSGNPWTTGTPATGSGYGPGDCVNCTPFADGQGSNPWTTGTPTPGSGYGPGPGSNSTLTTIPGSGNGTSSQSPQHQGQPTASGSGK